MQQSDHQKTRQQSAESEPLSATAQHSRSKPDKDDREPSHKSCSVETQLGQTILALIKSHALNCRSHYHEEHQNLRSCENEKDFSIDRILFSQQPVRKQQKRQHKSGNRNKFEKSPSCILGICQSERCHNSCSPAKEI